ncbi:MAG: hypothetical protein DRR19_19015 [Candidatus Parabeggiatoa sp. nov. 1]|nr:MAG: hypothetical protein DRR19_19015 [Gammaproteobacteria bacterium]
MRILIQGDEYNLNVGDISMLQMSMARLRELWPDVSLEMLTGHPDHLAAHVQDVKFVGVSIQQFRWFGLRKLLHKWVPTKARKRVVVLEDRFKTYIPSEVKFSNLISSAVNRADAIIFCGAGAITDQSLGVAMKRLEVLEKAIHAGKPTAIFGQGIGPVEQPQLAKRIREVLSKVDLIALREKYNGLPLLTHCGIDSAKIMATGDDAIEMAYSVRANTLGNHIGVNLRVSSGSELSTDQSQVMTNISTALSNVARRHNISLIPIPIDHSDHVTISELLQTPNNSQHLNTPLQVIGEIKRCRVVVTGAYHAAVFALSMGISAICLAKSSYYVYKHSGLADQFGNGCEVLFLDDIRLREKLETALENVLENAQENRQKLLQRAQLQIQASREAYRKFYDLVEERKK